MGRGIAGGRCESGDFGRRVLRDEAWNFEQVSGASGDEPCSSVSIATSVAAHPRRSPLSFGVRRALRGGRDFFDHGWTQMHTDQDLSVFIRVHLWLYF